MIEHRDPGTSRGESLAPIAKILRRVVLNFGLIVCSASQASSQSAIESFGDICGAVSLSLDARVSGLKNAGWGVRHPHMWDSYHGMLEQAITATSISSHASTADWNEAQKAGTGIIQVVNMSKSEREELGIRDLNSAVLVPKEGEPAVLVVMDLSFMFPGKIQCIYSGPMPERFASLVTQMEAYGWNEKSDEFVHQSSIDETTNSDGGQVKSSVLVAVLQPKSSTYLGGAPVSEAQISIFTEPLGH